MATKKEKRKDVDGRLVFESGPELMADKPYCRWCTKTLLVCKRALACPECDYPKKR